MLVGFQTGAASVSAGATSDGAGPVGAVPQQANGDYDADDDGLIDVRNLDQLNAIRYDLDGDGSSDDGAYSAAFPGAVTGMGCPTEGCAGYELVSDLDFDTNGNGRADAGDAYWNDGAGWAPIQEFDATFDGDGYAISNLYIDVALNYVTETVTTVWQDPTGELHHHQFEATFARPVGLFGSVIPGPLSGTQFWSMLTCLPARGTWFCLKPAWSGSAGESAPWSVKTTDPSITAR